MTRDGYDRHLAELVTDEAEGKDADEDCEVHVEATKITEKFINKDVDVMCQ